MDTPWNQKENRGKREKSEDKRDPIQVGHPAVVNYHPNRATPRYYDSLGYRMVTTVCKEFPK